MRTHECPAPGCLISVPNHIFACSPHWRQLTPRTRVDIYATRLLPVIHPDRLEVIRRAAREWERAARG